MLTDTLIRLRTIKRAAPALRRHLLMMWRSYKHWRSFAGWRGGDGVSACDSKETALWKYFSEHKEGRGIWKFNHYFEAYERHFARFRGRAVHVLEIGVYSGGSLDMWRSYFGVQSKIYGVDIEPSCKAYESDGVKVLVGDQSDRASWRRVRQEVPDIDVVIDDGGHTPEQQIVTLEELLPHLRPGGVYMCEDVSTTFSEFTSHLYGMLQNLNAGDAVQHDMQDSERRQVIRANPLQSYVHSINLYPFLTVIERNAAPVLELIAPKHGTQWEPFLK